jgi:hypothetical protein
MVGRKGGCDLARLSTLFKVREFDQIPRRA